MKQDLVLRSVLGHFSHEHKKIMRIAYLAAFAAVTMIPGNASAEPSQSPTASSTDNCESEGAVRYACGAHRPEDLVRLPGTPFVFSAGFAGPGQPGDLYSVDARTGKVTSAAPGTRIGKPNSDYPCDSPPDPAKFIAHGLGLLPRKAGQARLFVVNHGSREAIEVFDIKLQRGKPQLSWVGCVAMPEGVEANAVTPLPGGGMLVTSLYEPGDHDRTLRMGRLMRGEPSGRVFEWHPRSRFQALSIPPVSGPNGIAVSPDGRWIFLAGYGDRHVWRVDRRDAAPVAAVAVDFLPDNLRWASDGTLLVAGQKSSVTDLFACASRSSGRPEYCTPGWGIIRIKPETMTVSEQRAGRLERFGDATVALDMGETLWLGSISGSRIAIIPARVR